MNEIVEDAAVDSWVIDHTRLSELRYGKLYLDWLWILHWHYRPVTTRLRYDALVIFFLFWRAPLCLPSFGVAVTPWIEWVSMRSIAPV